MITEKTRRVIVRIGYLEFEQLTDLLFTRYPDDEWATFLRFGWREIAHDLLITTADIQPPGPGDLDASVGHVRILEPYSLRMALESESHSLAVGVVHSHPQSCPPIPSPIDDDMDNYYSEYFSDFAKSRPYVSLIVSKFDDEIFLSGRVFWNSEWMTVDEFIVEGTAVQTWPGANKKTDSEGMDVDRTARFAAAFGEQASERLRNATIAVIGAGGTGSMAIEVLARAGIGKLIVVDPDRISASNLERMHGSLPQHVTNRDPKVAIAREHIVAINPRCKVEAYLGALPQKEIVDAVVAADVALGCTDQQHSRLALSDICVRYLVPVIDCGVMLEGAQGVVTGQIIQLVRFRSYDPCALCRDMINPIRVAQELMSEEEKRQRRAAAEEAIERGEDPDPYWQGMPQLNTVGYLTGAAGALAAAYAIGWITGRFQPPFMRLQMNLVSPWFDVQDVLQESRDYCTCTRIRGWADQGRVDAFVSAPAHWPRVQRIDD
jgi:ThiF family protein